MFKKIMVFAASIGLLLSAWFAWDFLEDRSNSVKIIKPTSLYKNWEPLIGEQGISEVQPGENLKVTRIRYGKDYMAIKVEREDESFGWIVFNSDSVELIRK